MYKTFTVHILWLLSKIYIKAKTIEHTSKVIIKINKSNKVSPSYNASYELDISGLLSGCFIVTYTNAVK